MGHARLADSRPGSCCAGGGNSRRGPALGASARGGQRRGCGWITGRCPEGRLMADSASASHPDRETRCVRLQAGRGCGRGLQAAGEAGRWRRESKARRFGESTLARRHFGIRAACELYGQSVRSRWSNIVAGLRRCMADVTKGGEIDAHVRASDAEGVRLLHQEDWSRSPWSG